MGSAHSQSQLIRYLSRECDRRGLLWHSCGAACSGSPGWPGFVVAGDKGILFPEIKDGHASYTGDEARWMARLAGQNIQPLLFHPHDWPYAIYDKLKAIS